MPRGIYIIITVSWLLILLEGYILFMIIIPSSPPIHTVGSFTLISILKVFLTFLLGLVWYLVVGFFTNLYSRRKS